MTRSVLVSTSALTRQGARERNEDALLACEHPFADASLFAVCDGLGAQRDGAQAAQTAIDAVQAAFFAMKHFADPREALLTLLRAAKSAVGSLSGNPRQERIGRPDSTIVLLLITQGLATCAHLGDSRVYRVSTRGLQPLTADHSLAAALQSRLPPRSDPDRTKLLRTVSSDPRPEDVGAPLELADDDMFLLCSDGLWQSVDEEEMHRELLQSGSPDQWLARLERAVLEVADEEQDNFTALSVSVGHGVPGAP
jgi:PPM family protein phosphatase